MKKLLMGLAATPMLVASCNNVDLGATVNWGTFTAEGTAITNYKGTLSAGVSLNTKLADVTVTNWVYSHALEMREDDVLVINLPTGHGLNFKDKVDSTTAGKQVLKFEKHIVAPMNRLSYCPNQTDDKLKPNYDTGMFINSGNRLVNKAFLSPTDPKKINKTIVDLSMLYASDFDSANSTDTVTDEEYKQAATNYNAYLDAIGATWKDQFLNCNDIGAGKTYENLEAFFKGGVFNQPSLLTLGNTMFFEMKGEQIAFGINTKFSFSDFGGVEYYPDLNDLSNKKYVTPSLGINLNEGSEYLRTNWLKYLEDNSVEIIGKY